MATAISSRTGDLSNPPGLRRPSPGSQFTVPALLCLLGMLCLAIDVPVAAYFRSGKPLRFLREVFDNAEFFGHGIGVGFLILSVMALDRGRRSWLPRLLGGAYGAGLAANGIKLLIGRTRPRNLDLAFSSVWDTFHGWLPLVSGAAGDSPSFPSAHTATATGFAVVLSAMYPHGRWLFFSFAALAGMQRIQSSAHFPSDVCFGAAVGWIVGQAVLALRRRIRGDDPAVAGL